MDEKEYNGLFDQLTRCKDSFTPYSSGYVSGDLEINTDDVVATIRNMRNMINGIEPTHQDYSTDPQPKKDPNGKLTLGETLDLLSRGLKPYFVDQLQNQLVELTIDNEGNSGHKSVRWLHPKIAEKIQERYREMNALEDERDKTIERYDAQIAELEERIKKIAETGTDLII
jgi:hypothetical protein